MLTAAQDRVPRILFSAGEASGDRLGAGLAEALLERRPELELVGMGGERMAAAGVRLVQDCAEVSVVGIVEVLAHLPAIRGAMDRLRESLHGNRPDLVVPIDYPEFNLRLSRSAKELGVPVCYYVSPQVWAWRPRRVHRIRELVSRMLVLFPFETEIYEQARVPVSFVGYPVVPPVDAVGLEGIRQRAGLPGPSTQVVALLPGSRRTEVQRQLPGMLAAARQLRQGRTGFEFLIPLAPGLEASWMEQQLGTDASWVRLHRGDYPGILQLCQAGIVAAGTATLDAALAGLPIVVVYRMSWTSYWIGRALVRLEHVALPNLVAGRRVVPELLQHQFTPSEVVRRLEPLLEETAEAKEMRRGLAEVRERLDSDAAFARAADAVIDELDRSTSRSR